MVTEKSFESKAINFALKIARKAHEGQKDKGGQPYINHPMAVADLVKSQTEKIVALLHDVCEDSDITIDDLRVAGFNDEVLEAVKAITKVDGESYEEYLDRVARNPVATTVKIADMTHNSDLSRIPYPGSKDFERVERYKANIQKLIKK